MASVDNELEELRRRAYGRQGDIHLDSVALQRLRELEAERATQAPDEVTEPVEPIEPVAAELPPVAPEPPTLRDEPEERDAPSRLRGWFEWLSGLRRSTIAMALSVLVVIVAVIVTMTLVQRVQTDPLQTGASQIARLTPDSGYPIPEIFGNQNARAYQEFHGLRAVISMITSGSATHATMVCLSVYSQDDMTDPTSTSFSGQFFGGCAAGGFPAMAQIDLQTDGLPKELRAAVAPSAALQFVYDKRDHEVVVFGSK